MAIKQYPFYLVNVFAENHFGGNPLAVFPEADSLTSEQMQLIARQFNLSETVFILSPQNQSAVRKYRIFTPEYEMPFAGHPTIGASFILNQQEALGENYIIETQAGLVGISHSENGVSLTLKNGIETKPSGLSPVETASFLGLNEADVKNEPVWVNTGTWQLLVELTSAQAVHQCVPQATEFLTKMHTDFAHKKCYVWHRTGDIVTSRMFFAINGAILEDPGTGSAAANLGGWHILNEQTPVALQIHQGDKIHRPNRLALKVDEQNTIFVGGKVICVGQGQFAVPDEQ